MIAQVEQGDGTYVDEDRRPACGDYCDSCGDCLHCFIEDRCYSNEDGAHLWVIYLP